MSDLAAVFSKTEKTITHCINNGCPCKKQYQPCVNELVEAGQVEKEAARVAKLVREEIFKLPGKLSSLLAAEKDSNKCYRILYDELEDTLRRLGKEII